MMTLPTLSGNMFTRYCPIIVPYENPQKLLEKRSQMTTECRITAESGCSHQGVFTLKGSGNEVHIANHTRRAHVGDRLAHGLLTHGSLFLEEFVCLVLLREQTRTDVCD